MTASYTGMNPEGTGALTDHDQLWQSVTKILTTPTGSRVMRREFGSAIPDLLDAPQNAVTRMQLMGATAIALAQWEPRISLTAITFERSENDGTLYVDITGTRPTSGQSFSITISLS